MAPKSKWIEFDAGYNTIPAPGSPSRACQGMKAIYSESVESVNCALCYSSKKKN